MMMKCYLEIEVPVRYDALWFKELRDAYKGVDVRWQRAWHHITMAFLDEMPAGVNFRGILDKHLKHYQAPELTFDKVDSFRTKFGMPIIYLSVTLPRVTCNLKADCILHPAVSKSLRMA